MQAMLKRVVNYGDSSHYMVEERSPQVFEVIEGIGVLLKIRMKDKTPPCVIRLSRKPKNSILKVFYSSEVREPTEALNHGSELNVSTQLETDNLDDCSFDSLTESLFKGVGKLVEAEQTLSEA